MQLAFASEPLTRLRRRAQKDVPLLLSSLPFGSLTGASLIKQGERAIHPWVKLSIRRDTTNVAY